MLNESGIFFSLPSVKSTLKDEVIERVLLLKEVTQSDLRRKFICFAQNSLGNTTQSIQLKEKKGGKPGRLLPNAHSCFYLRGDEFCQRIVMMMIAINTRCQAAF